MGKLAIARLYRASIFQRRDQEYGVEYGVNGVTGLITSLVKIK